MKRFLLIALIMCVCVPAWATGRTPGWSSKRLNAALSAFDDGRFVEARRNFALLAEHGSAVAETMLGIIYARGHGVEPDPATAVTYFYRAANRGYPAAQLALADALLHGKGARRDLPGAYLWLRLAEQHGNGAIPARASRQVQRLRPRLLQEEIAEVERAIKRWRPWAGPTP